MVFRSMVTVMSVSLLAIGTSFGGAAGRVSAQPNPGIVVNVTYTGDLGPVSSARPLCLCIYTDPDLNDGIGCYIAFANDASFPVAPLSPTEYFFIAFLDPNFDEILNPGESFGIYNNRLAPPADPVTAAPDMPTIDITFGDESLTPTVAPSETATETPTPTPTPRFCAGDCDGSGQVTADELLILVNIALGNTPLQACADADTDGSNAIEITEILVAVHNALSDCPGLASDM